MSEKYTPHNFINSQGKELKPRFTFEPETIQSAKIPEEIQIRLPL